MNARLPLVAKILFLAFLNLCLLALVIAVIVRVQFRMDARSFLLAPAQDRIVAVAHGLSLELDEMAVGTWDALLARYSQTYGVGFYLYDERGDRFAGPELELPREVVERIPRRGRRRDGPPDPPRDAERKGGPPDRARNIRQPAPPLFLLATSEPIRYWAGVRIPVRENPGENPKPGTLILMSHAAFGNKLFFDFKPWLTVVVAVVLVSVAIWLPFIRGMTRSISQMTRTARQIAEGRFEIHVADQRRDEIGQLGETINRMASRLSGFVNGQKRFLSGIAHELCTPIATIQFGLGNLERRVDEQQRAVVADIQEEVQHMSALVNELLSFSRVGMQAADIKRTKVNVNATVARTLEREASSETTIEVSVDEQLNVLADPEYLFRALSNVVRNAIRYAGHAGPIRISARALEGTVHITIADCGPGVPEHALDEIFAPFYRLDLSRRQETGGVGLGLAIVKASIEACHGSVVCRNVHPSGLEVDICLPEAA
ncbi:MAG: HAMP domain-containing histidine kinase [Bryobacterales bacterium]|nr:HAMP domain-containing histidine kinase [Bryobacterales bacterium]